MTVAFLGLKVQIRGQVRTSKVKVKGRTVVSRTLIASQGQFSSFVCCGCVSGRLHTIARSLSFRSGCHDSLSTGVCSSC